MNVIFLDFDGVLNTLSEPKDKKEENREKRIKILSDICSKYDCKVVLETAHKDFVDEETMKSDVDWINKVLNLFKKYNIECIGKTPTVKRITSDCSYYPIWKEYEIRKYLFNHPEVDHYAIIDDDDAPFWCGGKSDLDMVRKHLVKTEFYLNDNPDKEGLLEKHIDEVNEKLQEENEIKKFALKKQNK